MTLTQQLKTEELLLYPEEIRAKFIETDDLVFRDGRRVSAEEIWHFMTEEGPRRFPYAFSNSPHYRTRISNDVEFLSGIKRNYFNLTAKDRYLDTHEKGIPIILVQKGTLVDPYFAAGGIPIRPGLMIQQAQHKEEGLNLRQTDLKKQSMMETSRRAISIEACDQVLAHSAIQEEIVPIDLIAPCLCLNCSDMAYFVESYRQGKNIPRYLIDYPINRDKEWAVEYFARMLFTLTQKIEKLTGKEVADKDFKEEIKFLNKGRRLAQEYNELWSSAKTPPTNSADRSVIGLAEQYSGDEVAAVQILKEAYQETKERIKHSIKGEGIADDPARIFICGSCATSNQNHIDKIGGVVVGRDDGWSTENVDVKESGDIYENLSKAYLSLPYELPTEERGLWIAEQAINSRADGLIFSYQWGCNYQTAVGRMIVDIVTEEIGIPSIIMDLGGFGRLQGEEQSENRIEAFIEMLK